MPNKFYSLPKSVFEHYHAKLKDWVRAVLPTKTSDLTNDSDFLDQLALAGIIAVTFSASSTYKVGDYVLYNHTLYRCKTAITTAGAWDASKWDAAKTQDIFKGSAPGLVPTPTAQDVANKNMLAADGTFVPHQDLSEYIKEVNLGDIVAEVFSTSKTYAVGDYVIHEKKLYRCTTAVSSAGNWSISNWTQVKSTDIFSGSAPGLVPAAESGDADKVLKGDGTWGVVSGGSTAGDNDKVAVDANAEPNYLENVLVSDSDIVSLVKLGNVLHVQVNTASTALYTCDEAVINGATNNYGSYALANGYDKLVWDDPSSYSWLNASVIQMKRLCTSQGTVTKCNIAISGTLSLTSPPAFINCGIFNTDGKLLGSTGLRLYGTDFFSGSELVSFDMTEVNTGDLNLKNNTYYIIQIITCGLQLAALSHADSYNYTYDHGLRMNMEGNTSKAAWSNINDLTARSEQIPWISFTASPSV